jgi:hypothetical protein
MHPFSVRRAAPCVGHPSNALWCGAISLAGASAHLPAVASAAYAVAGLAGLQADSAASPAWDPGGGGLGLLQPPAQAQLWQEVEKDPETRFPEKLNWNHVRPRQLLEYLQRWHAPSLSIV